MNSNLPMTEKNNIFLKIGNFLFKIFAKRKFDKRKNVQNDIQDKEEITNKNIGTNFKNELKVKKEDFTIYKNKTKEEKIAERINQDPNILNELSISRLEKVRKIFEDRVNLKKEKIKRLKMN